MVEGCAFRDLQSEFDALGVNIVGVSFDPPPQNAIFKENESFEFPLWTDAAKELALFYGAASSPTQQAADRVTVVLDANGTWLLSYVPGLLSLGSHAGDVLSDCEALFGSP